MNILVIARFQDDGSSYVSFVQDQVLAYKTLGHNVCVVSPVVFLKHKSYEYKGIKDKIVDGVKVYYPRYLSFSNYGIYGLNSFSGYHITKSLFKKIIGDFKPDVIHAHTIGFEGKMGVKLKQKYHIPIVITTHGSDTIKPIKNGKASYITNVCKKADAVVAVSSRLGEVLQNEDNSITPYIFCNGFKKLNLLIEKKKKNSIIQVSSLIKQKKVDITIRAFEKIKRDINDITLTIVGDGPEKLYLLELCQQLNLSDSVLFTGQISNHEVLKLMSQNEYFIMPSVREGFGIVYLEAMASGCITIGTKGEGIEDVIIDKENGFLVEPDNIEEIASYIKLCNENADYSKAIVENAKKSVANLTWEENAKKYINLFQKLLNT